MKFDNFKHARQVDVCLQGQYNVPFKKTPRTGILIPLNLRNNNQCNFGDQGFFIPDSVYGFFC